MKVGLIGLGQWGDDSDYFRYPIWITRFTWNPLHTIVGEDEEGKVFAKWWPLVANWGTDEFCNPALSVRLPGGYLWIRTTFPLRSFPCETCYDRMVNEDLEPQGRLL